MTARKPGGRKPAAAKRIPEEVQAPYQHRLKVLRTARGLAYKDIHTFGPQTIHRIENVDISTLKFGDLASLSAEYGMTLHEMLQVLASGEDEDKARRGQNIDEERRIQRLGVYLRTLPDAMQDMVVDIVHRVMVHNTDARTAKEVQHKPVVIEDTDTRALLRRRLREAQEAEMAQRGEAHVSRG